MYHNQCNEEPNMLIDTDIQVHVFDQFPEDRLATDEILEKENIETIFKQSIALERENQFCKKTINFVKENNNLMENCQSCNRVCCKACLDICHKNCTFSRTEDIFYNHVKLYYSYCECKHTADPVEFMADGASGEKDMKFLIMKRNQKLPCFLSEKFNEIFHCKEKDNKISKYLEEDLLDSNEKLFTENISKFRYYKDPNDQSETVFCHFCFINCEAKKPKYNPGNYYPTEDHIQNPQCECNEGKCMSMHDDPNKIVEYLMLIFNNADVEQDFTYDELNEQVEVQLRNFYGEEISSHPIGQKHIEYQLDTFNMLQTMYFQNLNLNKLEEKEHELMLRILNKIENYEDNEVYFVHNRLNLTLSYITEFYKEYLFQYFTLMEKQYMNLAKRGTRRTIYQQNAKILKEKKNFMNGKFKKIYDIDYIIKIFKKINEISCFSINIDYLPENKDYPFVGYFFLLIIKCYCWEKDEIVLIKDFVLKARKSFEQNTRYNHLVKKLVDESLYICQVFIIDEYFKDKKKEDVKNLDFDGVLFFLEKEFKSYLKIKFDSSANPSAIMDNLNNNHNSKAAAEELILMTKEDLIVYFDIFNDNFIFRMCFDCEKDLKEENNQNNPGGKEALNLFQGFNDNGENLKKFSDYLINRNIGIMEESRRYKQNNKYPNILLQYKRDQKLLNAVGYFDKFVIPYHKCKGQTNTLEDIQKSEENSCKFLLRCINRILLNYDIDLDKIQNNIAFDEVDFLEDAYTELKKISISKYSKKILVLKDKKYLEEEMHINIGEIDLSIYKEEMLYLFFSIFVHQLYRSPQFKIINLHWNFLIFLFLGRKENIVFLLRDVKFFDFLLSKKYDENGKKKSYLLKCLYNPFGLQREKNFTWRYFNYIFKHYIDKGANKIEGFDFLKILILENYINEIIQFYQIQHVKKKALMKSLKQTNENNLINTMNFNFICKFLKITKSILMEKNMQDFSPFFYNVNKFETIEQLSLIADIAFSEDFDVRGYMKTFIDFIKTNTNKNEGNDINNRAQFNNNNDNYFKDNNEIREDNAALLDNNNEPDINNNNNDNVNIELNERRGINEPVIKYIPFKKLNKYNVQYEIMDILGSSKTMPYISTYFNIINRNVITLEKFLENKNHLYNSFGDKKENYRETLFNLEFTIVKFLLNFLMVKIYNPKFGGFFPLSFNKGEISKLMDNKKDDGNFKEVLEEDDMGMDTRFLVNQMRIKIMKIFMKYFKANNKRIYLESEEVLPRTIFRFMYWILKKYFIRNLKDIKENLIYHENFKEFFRHYLEFNPFEKDEGILGKLNVYSYKFTKKFENIDKYQEIVTQMDKLKVVKPSLLKYYIDNKIPLPTDLRFFSYEGFIVKFFEMYIQYENKRNNLFNDLIMTLIDNEKQERDKDKKNRKISELKTHNHKNKEEKESGVKKTWNNFWCKINSHLQDNDDPKKLNYLIDSILLRLEESSKFFEKANINLFDVVFNENFLEILNFLNQILYYQPELIRNDITDRLNSTQMRMLMTATLKLSEYIIGISESETNVKLFSTSKIYFTLMDFYLFLCEGVFSGPLTGYFFENLKPPREHYNGADILDKINDLFEEDNGLMIIEKITEKFNLEEGSKIVELVEKLLEKNGNYEKEKLKEIKGIIEQFNEDNENEVGYEEKKVLKQNSQRRATKRGSLLKIQSGPLNTETMQEKKNVRYGLNIFDNFINVNRRYNKDFKIKENNIDQLNDSTHIEDIVYTTPIINKEDISTLIDFICDMAIEFKFIRKSNFDLDINTLQLPNDFYNPKNKAAIIMLIKENKNKFNLMCEIFDTLFIGWRDLVYIYQHKVDNGEYELTDNNRFDENLDEDFETKFNNFNDKLNSFIDNFEFLSEDYLDKENLPLIGSNEFKEIFKDYLIKMQAPINKIFLDFEKLMGTIKNKILLIKEKRQKNKIPNEDNDSLTIDDFVEFIVKHKPILIELSDNIDYIKKFNIYKFENENENNNNYLKNVENLFKSISKIHEVKEKELLCRVSLPKKQEKKNYLQDENSLYENFNKTPEEEDNFFYQNFRHMNKILSLITNCQLNYVHSGSERLIIQFLYISRFIKEFTEINYSTYPDYVKNIVKNSFRKLFNIENIFTDSYGENNKYRMIIVSSLLKCLIAFLEEFQDKEDKEYAKFVEKLDNKCSLEDRLYLEIFNCFKRYHNYHNSSGSANVRFNEDFIKHGLSLSYQSQNCYYESDEIQLAQLYNCLLNILKKSKSKLIEKYEKKDTKNDGLALIKVFNGKISEDNEEGAKGPKAWISGMFGNNSINHKERELKAFYSFYKEISRHIEVRFTFDPNADEVEYINRNIYFFKHPRTFSYSKALREEFLDEVKRDSLGSKIDAFNKDYDKFLFSIDICFFYRKGNSILNYFFSYKDFEYYKFNVINYLMVVALNIALMFYFWVEAPDGSDDILKPQIVMFKDIDHFHKLTTRGQYVLYSCIPITFIQIAMYLIWIYYRFHVKFWINYFDKNDKSYYILEKNKENDKEEDKFKIENEKTLNFKHRRDPENSSKIFNLFNSAEYNKYFSTWEVIYVLLKTLLFEEETIFVIWGIIFNIFYICFNEPIFIILQVASIYSFSPFFKSFYKVIMLKKDQFGILLAFSFIIVYIFSWFGFLYLQDLMLSEYRIIKPGYDYDKGNSDELICSTAIECFLNFFHLGLRSGGGIGDVTLRTSLKYNDKALFYWKVIYENFFFIICNLILLNIFVGVIVDGFNDMRDLTNTNQEDKKNRCFICNLSRFNIKSGKSFSDHKKYDHYIFDYVYVYSFLDNKNNQEFSVVEDYVWGQINSHKKDYLPAAEEDDN